MILNSNIIVLVFFFSVEPSVLHSKQFLDTNVVEPWDNVKVAWEKTQQMRKDDLTPLESPV